VLHQVAAGVVDDQRMRGSVMNELPGGERRALVARPSLVDIDVDRYPLLHREVDRRGRCAVVDGGEPAGVAMSEDVDRLSGRLFLGDLANNGEPVPADGAVDGDVFGGDLGR